MVNYQNGKIYKIISDNTVQIYIGSTVQKLCRRLAKHKSDHKCGNCIKSKIIIDQGNYKIILIENYPCNNREELLQREQHHIDQNKDICVNCCNAIGIDENKQRASKKEYYQANKHKIAAKQKEYYQTKNDTIKTKQKEYREKNKDKIKEYYQTKKDTIKTKQKEYIEANKDKIKTKQKEHYQKNRDKILTKNKEYRQANRYKIKANQKVQVQCDNCDKQVTKGHLAQHKKSKYCQNYIKSTEVENNI